MRIGAVWVERPQGQPAPPGGRIRGHCI